MPKTIRLALIGCGNNMRGAHLKRIRAHPRVELVAACDSSSEAAERLRADWGAPLALFSDDRKMIKTIRPDAVFISTPHSLHYEQARRALLAGAHVLVEKPLTIRPLHTQKLMELARRTRRILYVSYQRHHYPAYRYARDLVRKGILGELRAIVGYVTQGWGVTPLGWRMVPKLSGGGMLMDTGSHLVAAALFVTGLETEEVAALTNNTGCAVDILATASIRFRGGALGSISTVGKASRHDERLAIHGSKGCLVLHLHQWKIKSLLLNDEPLAIPASYREETPDLAFFRWIQGGKGYEPPRYALEVARFTEAVYRSAKAKRAVRIRP